MMVTAVGGRRADLRTRERIATGWLRKICRVNGFARQPLTAAAGSMLALLTIARGGGSDDTRPDLSVWNLTAVSGSNDRVSRALHASRLSVVAPSEG